MQIGREIRRVTVARRDPSDRVIALPGMTLHELLELAIITTMALREGRIPLEYLLPPEAPTQSAEVQTLTDLVVLATTRRAVA